MEPSGFEGSPAVAAGLAFLALTLLALLASFAGAALLTPELAPELASGAGSSEKIADRVGSAKGLLVAGGGGTGLTEFSASSVEVRSMVEDTSVVAFATALGFGLTWKSEDDVVTTAAGAWAADAAAAGAGAGAGGACLMLWSESTGLAPSSGLNVSVLEADTLSGAIGRGELLLLLLLLLLLTWGDEEGAPLDEA